MVQSVMRVLVARGWGQRSKMINDGTDIVSLMWDRSLDAVSVAQEKVAMAKSALADLKRSTRNARARLKRIKEKLGE
jgi:hypothetical protein